MSPTSVSTERLTTGEIVALDTLEITSIPHASIIDGGQRDVSDIVEQYKREIEGLMSEVYQAYKNLSYKYGYEKEISLELLWITQSVQNQTFNANIRLFIVVRAIDSDIETATKSVEMIVKQFHSTLTLQKYDFNEVSYSTFSELVARIDDSYIRAIVKEERVENLQNQIFPFSYSFDVLPVSNDDLSKIVNVLIDHPNSAISMQLIPVVLNSKEKAEIDRITQALDTLSKGVMEQGVGNVSFALAEKQAAVYRYYSERKSAPLFLFNVIIYGNSTSIENVAGRVFGRLSTGEHSSVRLRMVNMQKDEVCKDTNFYPLPWAVNEVLVNNERDVNIWSSRQFSDSLFRLPYIITCEEATELFRIPIGCERISAGLVVNESGKGAKNYSTDIINAGDIIVGKLRSSSKGDTIGFLLKDLAKHMLVVGTPGSGKTTFSVSLLDRLWKEHNIPFLVIEPAKNEYRALVESIPDMQIFTPGKNSISPFVFNPFVPPKNVKLETYKSTLKTAFAAGVSMSTPLDKIFEESINNCYSDFRWLDTYTVDDKGKVFNISDFIKCFQQTFDDIGYTGDARNIGRAGVVRLNSLVSLFDNYFSIPIEDILQKPTLIELAAIENSDQKALIIALLLLSILAYVNANYIGDGGLKNVILLEEAHVLLDADLSSPQVDANPSAIAQGLLKRMLAEIRSYGVGIVIADQSPRKVSTDVVALTDMKMVFRLVESVDKQIIGDSTSMTASQIQRMAKLKPGEAFLFFNKLDEPEEVITPDYRLEKNIAITLSDESIKKLSTYWRGRADKLRPYPQCCYCEACSDSCDYSKRVFAREVARRIFVKNFRSDSTDFDLVVKVFGQITKNIKDELDGEPLTPELKSCIKMHLWRKIRYGTKIEVREIQIQNSLKK